MRRAIVIAVTIVAALALAGCAGGGADIGKLRERADAALARWADAVAAAGGPAAVVPVGEVTAQVGDWGDSDVGDNNKQALMAGLIEGDDLPVDVPSDGEVTWQDGTTASVLVLSAADAAAAIRAVNQPCDGCAALQITSARLTTGPFETTRGPATGPLWEFTIEGTEVKVTHVAIANRIAVVPPAWDPEDPPVGVWIGSAQGAASGSELTVAFVGAPLPGNQSCGEDYTTEAVESDLAVVVIVIRHPALTFGACTAVGAMRTAMAELAAPLGDRAVLQVYDGTPIRITLAP